MFLRAQLKIRYFSNIILRRYFYICNMKNSIIFAILTASFAFSCNTEHQNNKAENPEDRGVLLYNRNCTSCHGTDGKLQAARAKDLSVSTLSAEQTLEAIANGNPQLGMPAYKLRLKPDEIQALSEYVMKLRK
jgi:mono/diheme cytochrome c family protein